MLQRPGPRSWVVSPSRDSFPRLFGQRDFGRYFVDGAVVTCGVVIASAPIGFLAATSVTRFRFRFRTTSPTAFPVARIWLPRGFVKAFQEALEGVADIGGASRSRFLSQLLFLRLGL